MPKGRKRKAVASPDSTVKRLRTESDEVLRKINERKSVAFSELCRAEKILRTEIEANLQPQDAGGMMGSASRDLVIQEIINLLPVAKADELSAGTMVVCNQFLEKKLVKMQDEQDADVEALEAKRMELVEFFRKMMPAATKYTSPITIFPEVKFGSCEKCKLPAAWRSEFCEAHNIERGFLIKKSKIPAAGNGFFVTKSFAANEVIVDYTGPEATEPFPKSHTLIVYKKGHAINGNGIATFANTGRLPPELCMRYDRDGKPEKKNDGTKFSMKDVLVAKKDQKRLIPNATIRISHKKNPPQIVIKTTKPINGTIQSPAEVIISYGRGFGVHTDRVFVCERHDAEFEVCRGDFCCYDED